MTMDPSRHTVCSEHTDVVKGMTEVTVVLSEVRDTIRDVCRKFEAHTTLEGHPLMAQRVRNLEDAHARHTAILDRLLATTQATAETAKAVGLTVAAMQKAQEDRAAENLVSQTVQLDMKTKILAAVLALCGMLGSAAIALLKS